MQRKARRYLFCLLLPLAALRGQAPPDATARPGEFAPMTRAERAGQYLRGMFGAQAIAFTLARSGLNHGLERPREWERNARGFGYRVASGYGQHAIGTTAGHGIAFALGEDNRYFASGLRGFGHRLRYAVASSFLARHNDGSRSFSYSAAAGPAAGAFLSRLWQPPSSSSPASGAISLAVGVGVRAGMNMAREFAPRFVRKILE